MDRKYIKYMVIVCMAVAVFIILIYSLKPDKKADNNIEEIRSEKTTEESVTTEEQAESVMETVTESVTKSESETSTEETTTVEQTIDNNNNETEETAVPQGEPATEISGAAGTGILYNNYDGASLIAIDAGHQLSGNSDTEPIGPGSAQSKPKVASGTHGNWSGLNEYELTLMVSMKLKDALLNAGYNVVMIRETNDVDISNAERAEIANSYNADAFLRIHANGMDDTSVSGVLTMCQTASNPYCGEYYTSSRRLSDDIVNAISGATGAKNRGVLESDTMSGINWCSVPVTIIEMGFMTNETEDTLMATEDYQNKIVEGIVSGVNQYIAGN